MVVWAPGAQLGEGGVSTRRAGTRPGLSVCPTGTGVVDTGPTKGAPGLRPHRSPQCMWLSVLTRPDERLSTSGMREERHISHGEWFQIRFVENLPSRGAA